MATKIDLLPGYVPLERKRNRAALLSAAALALVASGLLVELERKNLALQTATEDRTAMEAVAAKTTAATAEATAANGKAAPINSAVAFMVSATKSGSERAALLIQVRQYIYEGSVVNAIDLSDGRNAIISGTVRDPNEYAAFLFNLRRASDVNNGPLFAGLPRATGPGGFASAQNPAVPFVPPTPTEQPIVILYPIKFTANGVLKNPVILPIDPVGGAAPAAAGAAGAPPAPPAPPPAP